MAQWVVDCCTDGIAAIDLDGRFIQFNRAGESILGRGAVGSGSEQWSAHYGLFRPDGETPFPTDELPLVRALRGENVRDVEMFVRNDRVPEGKWIKVDAAPICNEADRQTGAVATFRDITAQKRAEAALQSERRFLHHLIQSQDRDRQLAAHDLHDGVVQLMTGSLLRLESTLAKAPTPEIASQLTTVVGLLRDGIDEARRMIGGLRPPVIDELGVQGAVEFLIEHQCRPDGLAVEFMLDRLERLPAIYETTIFRIVQEALRNVVRHSGQLRAKVLIKARPDDFLVEISDRGQGFDVRESKPSRYGLRGIEERARLLGGTARIVSKLGAGTTVHVTIPRPSPGPADADSDET